MDGWTDVYTSACLDTANAGLESILVGAWHDARIARQFRTMHGTNGFGQFG